MALVTANNENFYELIEKKEPLWNSGLRGADTASAWHRF